MGGVHNKFLAGNDLGSFEILDRPNLENNIYKYSTLTKWKVDIRYLLDYNYIGTSVNQPTPRGLYQNLYFSITGRTQYIGNKAKITLQCHIRDREKER
jgi:hypothetical protein